MQRQRFCWITVLAALMAFLVFAQHAIANPNLIVKVGGFQLNEGETKLVSSKTVTIAVYDSAGEAQSVTINNKQAKSVVDQAYHWEMNYSLALGLNDININAGSTTFNFKIMYVTTPVPGLTYEVPSLPASGKISAFNNAITLNCPKGDVLIDSLGNVVDRPINFIISPQPSSRPDQYHFLASQVVKISVASGVYLMQPGQLTLSYDPNISSTVADQLAIWYSPDPNWNDKNNYILGGYTDARKHTVTAPFQFNGSGDGYYGVFLAERVFQEFTSQSDEAWAYSAVMPMWARGFVEPLPVTRSDNMFGLSTSINRLEFATMLVKGLGLPLSNVPRSGQESFSDVSSSAVPEDISSTYFGTNYSSSGLAYSIYDSNHMPVQYVETAARNGIIVGYPDGTFGVTDNLTREEAAVILARASNLRLINDGEKAKNDLAKVFADADSISPWAAPSVLAAYRAKLIAGIPVESEVNGKKITRLYFNPEQPLTRAEAITLTYRLLNKLKKI